MLRLIPKPLHRAALRVAHRLRHRWRQWRGVTGEGVSVIARNHAGMLLLVRHSYGPQGWCFPGGGIKGGEAPDTAARRELLEETGCRLLGVREVGAIDEELSGAPHRAHIYEGMTEDSPKADGREVVEARFFPTHSLPEPLSPRTRARLNLWQTCR